MKIFNWIWSKKQNEEVEVFEARPHRMVDEMVREFNADHGLPLDQLVGVTHETTKETIFQKAQATRAVL